MLLLLPRHSMHAHRGLAGLISESPRIRLLAAFIAILIAYPAIATEPHDYFGGDYKPQLLRSVNRHHLGPVTKAIDRGEAPWGGIDFMLRYFPNHPRALYLLTRLATKTNEYGRAEEYFHKAIRLYPDTPTTYLIYGIFLHKTGKLASSIEQYKKAIKLDPQNSEIYYNLGLAYFDKGDHKKAYQYGRDAYIRGYPLPGLKNKLKNAKAWEPIQEADKSKKASHE